LAPCPRRDPSGEECRGSTINRAISATGHFVQRAKRQAALRQMFINGLDAERQYRPLTPCPALKAANAFAQASMVATGTKVFIPFWQLVLQAQMFIICSDCAGCQWNVVRHGERRSGAQGAPQSQTKGKWSGREPLTSS
jgi:hypothetical protein